MDDFYKEYILDHYRNPRNFGHLETPTAVAEDLNPLCGDTIRVEIHVNDAGCVDDVSFSGKGCAISRAATSMLLESVRGKTLEEVARLSVASVIENVGIGISPARMKCATLGLKVLKSAALGHIATWPEEAALPPIESPIRLPSMRDVQP
jgi:nitrogen fixation NifU-like protein